MPALQPALHAQRTGPAGRLWFALSALAALAALGLWAWHHPLDRVAAVGIAALAVLLFLARPSAWLVLLPALWPVIDLAPLTGWIHVTESDALVLAVVAGVGLREAQAPPLPAHGAAAFRLSPIALLVALLWLASYGVSAWRTPVPLPPFDPSLFAGYKTPLNGLRLLKAPLLLLLLLPCLHAAGRARGAGALDRLTLGMTLGLLTASAVAVWERYAFPGLTNFSADYRTTGLFWEMHVGGAALDAWLALTLPFALAGFLRARTLSGRLLFLAVLAVGGYAILTTFSRGLYAAVAVSLVLLLLAGRLRAPRTRVADNAPRPLPGGAWLAAAVLVGAAMLMFAGGGYRGLAALLGFALAAYLLGDAARRLSGAQRLLALGAGLALGALTLASPAIDKGPYLAFGALCGVALVAAVLSFRRPEALAPARVGLVFTAASAVAAAVVGSYWGEGMGEAGIMAAAAAGLLVLAVQLMLPRPLWQHAGEGVAHALLALGVAGALATGATSYYVGERFSTVSEDLEGRMAHWREGAALLRTPADTWLGLGLGRYPEAYFWSGPLAANAGSWELPEEDGNRYTRLGAARHVLGFGELFRVSQHVAADTTGPFHYRMKVRAPERSSLHVEICRKHLLYTQSCAITTVPVESAQWTDVQGPMEAGSLTDLVDPHFRPSVLSLATAGRAPVDVDDIEIIDSAGRSLVANGDFQAGVDRWFFSSDRHHLPWHAKSLFLHVWVEQGVLGMVMLGVMLLAAAGRVALGRVRTHPMAAPLLAGLAGFVAVGIFDSLLDMPRMTLMLLFTAWLALCLNPAALKEAPGRP
ncbi:O-antigen ligase family protein [Denitromonas iodatirespirans]|uniref:O-antigen ligase family protein n=1 Tax=Denitromonas iodatirespirans TaxID=2795389 RepID=A0A944DBJ1_DENI1|nr:hypothetical protein [Denitromonas iodatirespirans]MBT0962367.1 hypothetical protein [Denitromonas iodatirespirans]